MERFREWADSPKPSSNPAVATYSFKEMDLRVVEIEGEPWFVAKDALSLMAYLLGSHGSTRRALNRDEVGVHPLPTNLSDGRLQMRDFAVISESGPYKLVTRSDKKEAPFHPQDGHLHHARCAEIQDVVVRRVAGE